MSNETEFRATWSTGLTTITLISVGMLIFVMVLGGWILTKQLPASIRQVMFYMPPILLMGLIPFIVRGYAISGGALHIRRLGWTTSFPISSIVSAEHDPAAMNGSIRLFGSGGLFGFFGWFRNKKLGVYHAYATNLEQAVVIKFSKRTIVVTPDDPQRFVGELSRRTRRD